MDMDFAPQTAALVESLPPAPCLSGRARQALQTIAQLESEVSLLRAAPASREHIAALLAQLVLLRMALAEQGERTNHHQTVQG